MMGRQSTSPAMCADETILPREDVVRLYTDAAVDTRAGGVGYGAVLVGVDSNLCGALEVMEPTIHTPFAVEVNAIIHGIRLLHRMNISHASVLSDSLTTIKMIRGELEMSSDVHHWIIQIERMIPSFQNISFIHVSKKDNLRADSLAKDALASRTSMLWLEDFPQWLMSMDNFIHCNCHFLCNCSK